MRNASDTINTVHGYTIKNNYFILCQNLNLKNIKIVFMKRNLTRSRNNLTSYYNY